MVRGVCVVNTGMTPSNMAYVLIPDVAVIINAQEINNRYVEEIGLSPSTQSVSTLTVYGEHKLKPGAALSRVYHLMQIGKTPQFFLCFSTGCTCDQPCPGNRQQTCGGNYSISIHNIGKMYA